MLSDPSPPATAGYEDAISYLFGLEKIGIKFGLENINHLLQNLGNPHRNYPSIHIAGTNGKGSTTQFLASILIASGRRVGSYTSPHLIDFAERIQLNASPVPHQMITEGISRIRNCIEKCTQRLGKQFIPTYFEVSTALAFWCFAQLGIDVAVVETGMGGRLDATNVLDPVVSVITNIALEHQEYLGDTIEEIAYEKSGIIKPGRPLVLGEKSTVDFFQNRCREMRTELYPPAGKVEIAEEGENGSRFHILGREKEYNDLQIRLLGRFQVENAFLAVRVCEVLNLLGWNISPHTMRCGLQSARWPGRMHILRKKPLVVADGAHNSKAAASLMENLGRYLNFQRLFLVFGCMRDKDIRGMLDRLLPIAERVILTRSKNDRAEEPGNIMNLIDPIYRAKTIFLHDARQAVARALDETEEDDLVLIAGSLYVVGDILPMFDGDNFIARNDDTIYSHSRREL